MIPGWETSGKSVMEVHFSHILTTYWGSFASVSEGVGSCRGWWILGQSYTTCLAVSSPILHLLQMVSTARPVLCSKYLSYRWRPLLRRSIVVCSFLDNFDSSQRSSLFSFHAIHPPNSFIGDFPPLVAHLMVALVES